MKTPSPFKEHLDSLKTLGRYLSPYKLQVSIAFLALSCAAFTLLFIGFGVRHLIDVGFSLHRPYAMNQMMGLLIICCFILATASWIRLRTTSWLSEKVSLAIRQELFDHLLSFDQAYLERAKTGEIMARLESDTLLIRSTLSVGAPVMVRSLLQLLGALLLLVMTSPKLTGCLALVLPLSLTPLMVMGRRVRLLNKESDLAYAALSGLSHEMIMSLKTLQSFCQEIMFSQKHQSVALTYLEHVSLKGRVRAFMIGTGIALIFSSIVFILWLGARDVFQGFMTFGDLSAFVFYAVLAAGSLNSLSDVGTEIGSTLRAFERILALKKEVPSIREPLTKSEALPSPPFRIHLKDLTFYYPSCPQRAALKEVGTQFRSGKTYALVGPSGAGKTTLFQLLQRFYDPQKGMIELNGQDIRALPLGFLRSQFALVPQEPYIFHATLWENIAFSAPQASPEEVYKAAELSYVQEFAQKLPQGYDTLLGERGVRLSGGQKQRLALARALLYKAPFLLLDEATNALDAQSEHHIQKALREGFKECTRLVIAHRFSTVLEADEILVLDQGEIVERGTHTYLLSLKGLYAHLAKRQFIS